MLWAKLSRMSLSLPRSKRLLEQIPLSILWHAHSSFRQSLGLHLLLRQQYLVGRYYAFAFTLQASRRFLWMFRRVVLRLSVLPPWEVAHPLEYWLLLFLRAIPKEDRLPSRTSHYCSSCDFRYHLKSIPREWCLSSQESVLFESFRIQISLPTVLHFALVLWTHILLQLFRIDLDIFGFQFGLPLILFQRFCFFLGLLALLGFLLETG